MQETVEHESPEDYCPSLAHENVNFYDGNSETKSWKLADENSKSWALFERSYSYVQLAARYGIARSSVEIGNTKLLPLVLFGVQDKISQQAFDQSFLGQAL